MHENLSIEEGFDVRREAKELGCNTDADIAFVPLGLAGAESKEELSYHDTTETVEKLAEQEDLELDTFIDSGDTDTTKLKSTELFLGGLFVTVEFLRHNFSDVATLINIVHEHYSRVAIDGEAQMSVMVEEDGEVTRIEYDGPIEGIDSVLDQLEEMKNDD
ncbi:hypothetical protein [Halorussus lipolyticus]|uniref:hypothetical protein n=1 Tax=Halorussus lipolyticus TaxID=3034024 RepID=UPI0023E8B53C|nr:hypothetical protein [Halorussus sp. DT80]